MNTREMIVQLGEWGVKPSSIAQDIGVTTRSIELLRSGERKEPRASTYIAVLEIWKRKRREVNKKAKGRTVQ